MTHAHRSSPAATRRLVAPLAAACLGALLAVTAARAQVLAMVNPTQASITVIGDEPAVRELVVSNLGAAPVRVRVRLSDWSLSERGEIGLEPLGSNQRSLKGALSVTPVEQTIAAGASGRIEVRVALDSKGPPTRWGIVLSEVRSLFAPAGVPGSPAATELGTTVLVSRVPADQVHAELVGLTARALGRDSIAITARVHNTGLRYFVMTGSAALTDSAGARLGGGPMEPGLVLPGAVRSFEWSGHVARGHDACIASATFDSGEPELLMGETRFRWPARFTPVADAGRGPR